MENKTIDFYIVSSDTVDFYHFIKGLVDNINYPIPYNGGETHVNNDITFHYIEVNEYIKDLPPINPHNKRITPSAKSTIDYVNNNPGKAAYMRKLMNTVEQKWDEAKQQTSCKQI